MKKYFTAACLIIVFVFFVISAQNSVSMISASEPVADSDLLDSEYTLEIGSDALLPFLKDDAWVARISVFDASDAPFLWQGYASALGTFKLRYDCVNTDTGETRALFCDLTVKDTTAPSIAYRSEFKENYNAGTKLNLKYTVTDNSGEEIAVTRILEKNGKDASSDIIEDVLTLEENSSYKLTISASDSSGNIHSDVFDFETGVVEDGGLKWYHWLLIGLGSAVALIGVSIVCVIVIRRKQHAKD